ncbi:right-handed parallel beta-helix repeat-containing protein [Streptomyces sp. NPDC047022]|uniref:right-handed parallel beta-helix repeat-containing protein n=1 Tax=Streptomyces sp. NPDC047022 TaxID=3155737 RepID=UPI0033CF4914
MRYTALSGVAALATVLVNGVSTVPAVAISGISVPCDTAALINAIATAPAGSNLVLARHCTYHLTTAYSGDDGLPPIDRQLTIEGRDSTIVRDGATAGVFRIFHVTSTGDLRLDDVTIRGGNAPDDGGGILVDAPGMLKLDKAILDNNTAGFEGGGVAVKQGATADITRSEFTFNNAADRGGGLQSDGNVTTDSVVFARNFAVHDGGAIDHDFGDAVYRNTTLKNNTTSGDGGGIDTGSGTVQFINSKIINNTTTSRHGGGIWNEVSMTLIKTEVAGNVAGGSDGQGGGIFEVDGPLVLRDSKVERNSANGSGTSQGGGIYNQGGAVTLDRSEVNNNASTVAPGGVWTDTQFTVNRSEIRHNIPTNCDGSPVIVTGCVG